MVCFMCEFFKNQIRRRISKQKYEGLPKNKQGYMWFCDKQDKWINYDPDLA